MARDVGRMEPVVERLERATSLSVTAAKILPDYDAEVGAWADALEAWLRKADGRWVDSGMQHGESGASAVAGCQYIWFRTIKETGPLLQKHFSELDHYRDDLFRGKDSLLSINIVANSDIGFVLMRNRETPWTSDEVATMLRPFPGNTFAKVVDDAIDRLVRKYPPKNDSKLFFERVQIRNALLDFSGRMIQSSILEDMREELNIAGPDVILADGERTADPVAAAEIERAAAIEASLTDLRIKADELELAKAGLDSAVADARRVGATWAGVGAALGITPQTANERWNPKVRGRKLERERERQRERREESD